MNEEVSTKSVLMNTFYRDKNLGCMPNLKLNCFSTDNKRQIHYYINTISCFFIFKHFPSFIW